MRSMLGQDQPQSRLASPASVLPPSMLSSSSSAVAANVRSLVQHTADPAGIKTEGEIQELCGSALQILSSRMSTMARDEHHVVSMIKKKLLRKAGNSDSALQFSRLHASLCTKHALKRRFEILYFLMAVGDQSEASLASPGLSQILSSSIRQHRDLVEEKVAESLSSFEPVPSVEHTSASDRMLSKMQLLNSYYADDDTPVPEAHLLRDIVFVFQGIDGRYIHYRAEHDAYVVDPSANISNPVRGLLAKLSEMGLLYRKIGLFVQESQRDPSQGLICQSFASALQSEITDYYRFVAVIEAQLQEPGDPARFLGKGLTLKRLCVWTHDPLQRLRVLNVLIDAVRGHRGGALISQIHNYNNHGDPLVKSFIQSLLVKVTKPFYDMLKRWIYEGELEDPYEEFFIAFSSPDLVDHENHWRTKYSIRLEMVPAFINSAVAKKILLIGKSINFIRFDCGDESFVVRRSKESSNQKGLSFDDYSSLEATIDTGYTLTSQYLLDSLFGKFKLIEHLMALKRYLLLGQGDFVQYLMDTLGPSLSKSAALTFKHNITATLEAAIRASNAQYDHPDIVRRLDVRLLEMSEGDTGWDVFTLDYYVDPPLNTILNPDAMMTYLKLFSFLWRLKRIEHVLSTTWTRHMQTANSFRRLEDVRKDVHTCHVVWGEMIHFIQQLQYYMQFEVLECSWDELYGFIKSKPGDLDQLITAHIRYLNNILTKSFLATMPGPSQVSISSRFLKLFEIILKFKQVQDALHDYCMIALRLRSDNEKTKYRQRLEKSIGLASGDHTSDVAVLDPEKLEKIRSMISGVSKAFRDELKDLLASLSAYPDSNLKFLNFRVNFNEFY
ncbi:Spc98 family-domain-containing protein [Polychytrium aggregatum]|uniref:Spc98 family-domain-containing protein n=1 Tax=Polychytrium aggregatum TaxID=110093 RepID=UPI0022FF3461|nr:Spc98 family-domain-containing protein [Polychytrium aggregatum]KAI9206326.1 Spc98 family-domain-containing protein [Polychytrium aggregatum]